MSALVLAFLTWIAAETCLTLPPPPSIAFVSVEEMRERAAGRHSVVALYQRSEATIYLPETWSRDALYDRAMLLHELVHHVQQFNGVPARCPNQREWQAYKVTGMWLAEQGVEDPYAFLNVDEFTVAILSLCPDYDELRAPPALDLK